VERDAVIVEVGLNEAATRRDHPAVPITPRECADDALRCHDAGAAIVHWHARDPVTGEQRLDDAALYGEALDRMRACGVLGYPSYPVDRPDTVAARLAHVWQLREHHGLELAPVDIGSVTIALWNQVTRDFVDVAGDRRLGVITNSLPFTLDALERAHTLGMTPTLGAFDVGFTRTMVMLADAGRLRPPILHKIFLSGALALGPFPSEEALDLHLRQIPDGLDVEWIAVPYALDDPALVERLCRHALARGGGIRLGIGDNPAAFPSETNAGLVDRATSWADQAGRPLASSAQVRDRCITAGLRLPILDDPSLGSRLSSS
jgi:3-keto-5-aminohexanoate cleavage enzyme